MKSSKMENILNFTPVPEENKSLSPLTYYQPFQSTFDPEFAMQPPKNLQEDSRGKWGHEVERQTGNIHLSQGRILNPWDQNWAVSSPQTSNTYSAPSTSSWGVDQSSGYSEYRPRHPFPGYKEDSKDFGLYENFLKGGDGRGGGFSSWDSSCRMLGVQPTPEASRYSFLGRNAFKTGQTRPMKCNFCKNNKEVPDIYLNHYLYDPETKVLTCPVLRKHVCEVCGETGDRAHTLQYCPVNRERGLQAKVPVLLKTRTITNSTGKIRRN